MKFHILIYWCQMNYADSARLKAVLENLWFSHTRNIEESDIVIFDTCSVRQKSEDKIFWKLAQIPRDKKIWITGCMVQHDLDIKNLNKKFKRWNFYILDKNLPKEELKENIPINDKFQPIWSKITKKFNNVELLFRIDDIGFMPLILEKIWYNVKSDYSQELLDEYTSLMPSDSNQLLNTNSPTAYVPIQTGCSQFCAYCIVPFSRWLEKNRPVDEIISEVKHYLNQWKQEIVLLGQIVNKHPDFVKIIREILKLDWLKWLRYTSPYPTYYSDELLSLHENEEKLVPHIHAPIQSGSNKILKKMFRWYTVEQYKEFVDKIRSLKRDISLTTDIIVWFSNESEEDFQWTLNITKYSRFDMIYIWIYSPRPGTYAAKNYEDNVPIEVKKQRWQILNDLLQKISLENNQKNIWKIRQVLITKDYEDGTYLGYDEQMKNIIIKASKWFLNVWDFVNVKIEKVEPLKMEGVVI